MSEPINMQLLAGFVAELCDQQAVGQMLDRLAMSAARERLGHIEADIARLTDEQARLQQTVLALRQPDVEQLLAFLPAIYRNFWGVVRPDEVAMMAGTFRTITLPSPYPEPSPETVLAMKQRLKSMTAADRELLLGFCRSLPHRLQMRTEMREFF